MSFRQNFFVKKLSMILIFILVIGCAAFSSQSSLAAGTKIGKVINAASLNVRSDASATSSKVAELTSASVVTVIGEKSGASVTDNGKTSATWYQITTADGKTGYVNSLYLEVTTDYSGWIGTVINVTSQLNVRSEASPDSIKIATLSPGATVTLLGETQGTAVNGTTLWYKIKTNNGETGYVSSYYLSAAEGTATATLATPTLTSVTNSATGVTVKWKAVSGAAKYRVFYKTSGGSWTKASDVTSTSCTVTGLQSGTTYTFTVRCVSSDGKSYVSGYNSTGMSLRYVAAPTISSVTNTSKGVTVKWNKVTGAEKYRVFYKTSGGSWTKASDVTSTSCTVTDLQSGTTYTFAVRCVSSDGKSYVSGYNSTGMSLRYVAAPTISSVTNTSEGVTVKWNKVTGAEKYRVFYKTSGGSWTRVADTTSTSCTVSGLKSGTTYTFTVRCVSSDGKSYVSGYNSTGKTIFTVSSDSSFQKMLNRFPESYWDGLTALHEAYPNWVFEPLNISLDWDDVIDKEVQDNFSLTSLVEAPNWTAVPSSYKCCESYAFNWDTGEWYKKDNGSLVCASRELIEYYMDPRNFFNSTDIFQFLEMSFDANTQTVAGVQAILNGSFMQGDLPDEPGTTYAQCIYQASQTYGANPYVIAAKLLSEQGKTGSAMVDGTYTGYEGYYNYFNYNAYGSGSAAIITNGLSYAKKQGWDSHRKSIEGGTQKYVSGYIAVGQSTPYLTRFDVIGNYPFTHQYASDILYAYKEGTTISKNYTSDIRNQALTFTIPVFTNMPDSACTKPSGNTSPYLKLKSLTISAGSISPRFQPEITSYTITLPAGTSGVTLTPTAMDSSATVIGGGTVSVGSVTTITVTSRKGDTKSYSVRVVSSAMDTSGISLNLDGGTAFVSPNTTVATVVSRASTSGSAKVFSNGSAKAGSSLVENGDTLVLYDDSGSSLGAFSIVVSGDNN